jgi:ankyrin repeat protein
MFKQKYLKYKEKYLKLKKQIGGNNNELLDAIYNDNFNLFKLLINKVDINATYNNGNTALIIAVDKNNLQIVQLLIAKGADINIKNNNGYTALIFAVGKNNLQIVQLLIAHGADVNIKNNNGYTALIFAIAKNNLLIATLLLENGANINIQNTKGATILINAIINKHLEILTFLIQKGADINIKDIQGNTALIIAIITQNLEIAKLLIEHGANINIINNDGLNAYFIACQNRNDDIAKLLITKGADTSLINKNNQQCIINTDKLDDTLKSVPIYKQQNGDCFAHAVARNFVRTLQILGIIKSQYNNQFYDLFYSIIIKKFKCDGGFDYEASKYLLHYLRNNILQIFNINEDFPIPILIEEDKQQFINDMNLIKNALYIINVIYRPKINLPNYPSLEIKKMLDQKLQPIIGFNYSNYLGDNYWKTKSNLIPIIIQQELSDDANKCKIDSGHAINLRKWMKSYVEFKNSWGTDIYNSGNFSVADIKQLSCINNNNSYNNITFNCLMFDELLLPNNIREKYNIIKDKLHSTCDIENNFDINHKLVSYKFYENGDVYDGEWKDDMKEGNGIMIYANRDVYKGEWGDDVKQGNGKMIYANGDIYKGEWEDDMKEGNGTMIYVNGDIYDGEWFNDVKQGNGKMIYNDKTEYNGYWEDDKKSIILDDNDNDNDNW